MSSAHELRSLFWEATLRCNACCEFCGSRCGDTPAKEAEAAELSAETICRCFREIAEAYDPSGIMINVTGGEALLRRGLFDIMSCASALGFPWGLVSNGSLIDEAVVEKLKAAGMKTISLSLDGLPETHDALRRLPHGFEKLRRAVALLKDADFLDELQITTVVNHRNIGELEALFPLLCEWGVDSWRIAMVDPIGRASERKELLLTDEDYAFYLNFFRRYQFNGSVTLTTSCAHYLGEFDDLYRSHSFRCDTGIHVGSILANGDIYVCPNVPRLPELIQGNVKTDSFPEVWEKGFLPFRSPERQKSGRCRDCGDFERCRGDSLHTWDFAAGEPLVCLRDRPAGEVGSPSPEKELKSTLLRYYPQMKGVKLSYGNSAPEKLLLTPRASEELLTYFNWGETDPSNCFEQLAGLVGFTRGALTVVEHVIPGLLEERSETTAAFSSRSYAELLRELEVLNRGAEHSHEKYRLAGHYSLVGIAHSHPLELTAALSIPDVRLQGEMERRHGGFVSLLLNPQKKQLAAYRNSVFTPIDAELLVKNEYALPSL